MTFTTITTPGASAPAPAGPERELPNRAKREIFPGP
jgi:hypothetical protein